MRVGLCSWIMEMDLKLCWERFRWDTRRNFPPEGVMRLQHSCTGRWWSHHPRRCSGDEALRGVGMVGVDWGWLTVMFL